MLPVKKLLIFLFSFTLLFTACEPKDKEKNPQPTSTLTANAGADQNVQTGQTVTLDGSASKDSENGSITYAWSFTKKPANSQVTLTGTTTANPTFVPDMVGEYEVELTVANVAGSQKDKVLITASFAALVLEDIEVKTVLEDRVADPNVADYMVNDDISVSAELTVNPGVVIAFAEHALMFVYDNGGAIIAKGEANKKIRFIGKTARKGFWAGIMSESTSSSNEFSHSEILHAGSKTVLSGVGASIILTQDARLTVKNTTISESGAYGIYLAEGSKLVSFSNNTLSNNNNAPMLLTAENITKLDEATVFTSSNGRNVIEVMGSDITGNGEVVWPAFTDNTPYRFVGLVTARTGLKLKPGTIIEVEGEDNYFQIGDDGYVNAVGTSEKKITFTGAEKAVGSWKGILVYSNHSKNVMEHVTIKYAGSEGILGSVKTSIALASGSKLSIKKSTISHSGGYGIHVDDTDVVLNSDVETSNTFTANTQEPVSYE